MRNQAPRRPAPDSGAIKATFTAALDGLIEQVKTDRSILAAILCGSLSHDTVWEKSDIDLGLVTVDDRQIERSDHRSLYAEAGADGVNVHVFMIPRREFRQMVESATHNSFVHSLLAKGRLLYTHDETIAALCERLREIGARDIEVQLLRAACDAIGAIHKAHKWFITRGDLDYTALWILYAATPLAEIEVLSARRLVDREVIVQALALNPGFFDVIYTRLLNTKKTRASVQAALAAVDEFVATRARTLFRPVLQHLREVGEARSASELEAHFTRHVGVTSVTTACEYLSDLGLVGKASVAARLTKKSNVDVQELAFFYAGDGD
jgi:predicted nucleotidyltransferase